MAHPFWWASDARNIATGVRDSLSLAVVGADFPNKRGPTRRFEIAICAPGDPVQLVPEPKNPADGNAIMIQSERGVQMGYVAADRTSIIHHAWRDARDVRAIFQAKTDAGAWIRVAFGADPVLPPTPRASTPSESDGDPDSDFYPDEIYPDD